MNSKCLKQKSYREVVNETAPVEKFYLSPELREVAWLRVARRYLPVAAGVFDVKVTGNTNENHDQEWRKPFGF